MQETGRYAVLLLSLLSFGLYAAYSALPMIAKEQTETVDACNCIFPRSYSLFYLTLLILESACRMMLLSISNDHQVNCVWNIKTPSFSGCILSFLLHICSSRDYTQDSVTIHNKVSESFIEGKENKKNKKQRQQHKEDNATTSSLTSLELPQPVLEEPIKIARSSGRHRSSWSSCRRRNRNWAAWTRTCSYLPSATAWGDCASCGSALGRRCGGGGGTASGRAAAGTTTGRPCSERGGTMALATPSA